VADRELGAERVVRADQVHPGGAERRAALDDDRTPMLRVIAAADNAGESSTIASTRDSRKSLTTSCSRSASRCPAASTAR